MKCLLITSIHRFVYEYMNEYMNEYIDTSKHEYDDLTIAALASALGWNRLDLITCKVTPLYHVIHYFGVEVRLR